MTVKRIISMLPGVKSRNSLVRIVSIVSYNLVAIAIVALLSPPPANAPLVDQTKVLGQQATGSANLQQTYLVTEVVDGDTIKIEGGQTIRYIGIDTPETVHPTKKVQCFGKQASDKNKELVAGKRVTLEKDVSETDRYGRLLRYVYVDGQMVNKLLVQEGFAHASSFPPDVKHQPEFTALQKQAREQKLGLWGECDLK